MTAPLVPSVFLLGAGAVLYRMGSGLTDPGSVIVAGRWESERIAYAGIGGEAIYRGLTLVLNSTAACTLRITPIVDDVVYDATGINASVDLVVPAPATARRTFVNQECVFSLSYQDSDGVEQSRQGLRGCWGQFRIDVVAGPGADADGNPGELILEGIALDAEVVRSSSEPIGSAQL